MKTEIIKLNNKKSENKSLLTPIIYLIIGGILVFKSDEAIEIFFYIIGIMVILYGIKAFINYYRNKDNIQFKNVNLTVAITSIIIGLLLIVLAGAINLSIRFLIGFFLIFMGVSRLLTDISFGNYMSVSTLSNILLIILGIYSVFVSHAVLVIVGVMLIINAVILFFEYFKEK